MPTCKKVGEVMTFEIKNELKVLSGNDEKDWTKEVNIVDWGGGDRVDIRSWLGDHEKAGKGITLSMDEAKSLLTALSDYFGDNDAPAQTDTEPRKKSGEPEKLNFQKE